MQTIKLKKSDHILNLTSGSYPICLLNFSRVYVTVLSYSFCNAK
jgi:hypothetical protein